MCLGSTWHDGKYLWKKPTNQIEMSDRVPPSSAERELLQYLLNRFLTEEDHLYIFTEILQNLEKKIYTVTETGTLFDLNDLPTETFWTLREVTQSLIKHHERQKEIETAHQEDARRTAEFREKMQTELQRIREENRSPGPDLKGAGG